MNSVAKPRRSCSSRKTSRTFACTETSSADVGSSATRRSGSSASARARLARWRCPPESSCGKRLANSCGRCTASSSSITRGRAARQSLARPWITSGSASPSAIVIFGLKLVAGSWNTNPIRWRSGRNSRSLWPTISWPSTLSDPPEACVSPAMARPIVVLPDPDSPTRPSTSPGRMSKLTPSTARNPGRPRRPG